MTDYTAALGTQYTLLLRVVLASQNPSANTSTLSWELYAIKNTGSGYYDFTGPTTWTVTIGPSAYSGSIASYDFRNYTTLLLANGTTVITHTASGSKDVAYTASWNPDNGPALQPGSISTGSNPLPTINRATTPTVSPSPATVAQNVSITLVPAVGSYTHTITWVSGSLSGTIATNSSATSFTWAVPNVMGEFPGKAQAPITITTDTKSGGVSIGTTSVTLMARSAPTYTDPSALPFPFDIRARLVTYADGTWQARRTIPANTIELVDPHSATATCTITMSRLVMSDLPDYSVVDIQVQDGNQWVSIGQRFVLIRAEDDDTDASDTVTYSGPNFVDYSLARAYAQKDYEWDSVTPGEIMRVLIADAKARSWGPRIQLDVANGNTTIGTAWTNSVARDVPKGTPLSQVLEGLVEDGLLEYRTDFRSNNAYLELYNPGTGSDWAVAGASPVVDLSTVPLNSAPRRGTIEDVITRVTVAGDGEVQRTRERAADDSNVFGQLEGWVAASGVKDDTEADRIGDNTLEDNRSANNERTFEFDANAVDRHVWPYFSVRPGDWVRIPSTSGSAPERARVGQITIQLSEDGDVIATILTGDRILSGTGALAKRQKASTGGAIPGGSLSNPATLDSSVPSAPLITVSTSAGYWTVDGLPKSAITLSWNAVTSSVAGTAIVVDYYEIWWRPDIATPWAMQTVTGDLSVIMPGWDVNKYLNLRVRGRSAAGIFGQWSLFEEETTAQPGPSLGAPGTPIVTANALGTIFAEWNGQIGGSAAPAHLAYVRTEVGTANIGPWSTAGQPLMAAGQASLDPGAYGTYYFRFVPVDKLGQDGTASSVVSITTVDPGLVLRTPAAPTGLTISTDTAYSSDGITLDSHFYLEWDDVTEDTDGDPITVTAYEVWGHTGSSDDELLTTGEATASIIRVNPGSVWVFKVRAISDVGARGLFSSTVTDTADGTVTPLVKPTTPTLSSSKSLLRINWDGKLNGAVTPPNQFRYVYAEYEEDDVPGTWYRVGTNFLRGGGAIFVPLDPGTEYNVRLTAVALDGTESPKSTVASATVVGIAPTDMNAYVENMLTEPRIETSTNPDEGVKLFNGGIIAYDSTGAPTIVISADDGAIYFANGVISGDAIITGSILADKIDVGTLVATLIASDLGNSLNLASNESVNILVGGAVASVQADVDDVSNNLGVMQTYYQFGPSGALITSPGSPNAIQITNSEIDMLVNGNIASFWNAAGLNAPSLIANQTATIGAHQWKKEGVRTTVRAI